MNLKDKVRDDIFDGWGHLASFNELVEQATLSAEARQYTDLVAWNFLRDYNELCTVVNDLIGNLIDNDNAAKIIKEIAFESWKAAREKYSNNGEVNEIAARNTFEKWYNEQIQ
jgi:hypothetical protein